MSWQKLLIRVSKPLVVWLGKLYLRTSEPKIKGYHYYKWRDEILPTDIILTSSDGEIGSNLINPSDIKHGGIYLGDLGDGVCMLSEALGEGITHTDLVSFLTSKDIVVVLRPIFQYDKKKVIESAISRNGLDYDYEFETNDNEYYCFEHIAKAFIDQNKNLVFKKSEKLGYEYYSSNSFLEAKNLFKVIIDSRDEKWDIK
jgi:hypothetical protein